MKNRGIVLAYLMIILCSLTTIHVVAQGDWRWAFRGSGNTHFSEVLTTDKFNNSYIAVYYNDTLSFNGQTYYHPLNENYNYNCLVLKVDINGQILKQLDIYSQPNGSVRPIKIVADSSGNLFIAGEFKVRIFIGDTVINHLPVSYYEGNEAYLAKISNNLDMEWAKVIGCEVYLYFSDLKLRNNNLCYIISSTSSPGQPVIMYCFGQDTISYYEDQSQVLFFNLDLDGRIISYNEIKGPGFGINNIVESETGDLYLVGFGWDKIYIDNSIVWGPPVSINGEVFIFRLDEAFNVLESSAVETNLIWGLKIIGASSQNELYFAATSSGDIVINNVTIPCNSLKNIFGKLTPQRNVAWYESIIGLNNSSTYPAIIFNFLHDTLYPAFDFAGSLNLHDTTLYNNGSAFENRILKYSRDGERKFFLQTHTSGIMHSTDLGFDKCGDVILTGDFQGFAYFGNDTLGSPYIFGTDPDFFVASHNSAHKQFDLGEDVMACGQFILHGPGGWDHYDWNNGLGNTQDLLVTISGQYKLTVWNDDCCSMGGSVYVTIFNKPEIFLGNDTILKKSQSLQLTAPTGDYRYVWSTGDTTSTIILSGSGLSTGLLPVWCQLSDSHCMNADTIMLQVIDDTGLDESKPVLISISPNPFSDKLSISCDKPIQHIEVMDLTGKAVSSHVIYLSNHGKILLMIDDQSAMGLILRLEINNLVYFRKVLQIR